MLNVIRGKQENPEAHLVVADRDTEGERGISEFLPTLLYGAYTVPSTFGGEGGYISVAVSQQDF
jgi:hypothetical protein